MYIYYNSGLTIKYSFYSLLSFIYNILDKVFGFNNTFCKCVYMFKNLHIYMFVHIIYES